MSAERILFLTGRLAETSLRRVLETMQPTPFIAEVHQLGLNVAGLMTADMIRRRLRPPPGISRIIVPGRCRGDLDALGADLGIAVLRGPDELKDLPRYFGGGAVAADLSRYAIHVFAEVVDAPALDVADIVQRARHYVAAGADIIDLGCLPDTPFPHLAESVQALKAAGLRVSVDSNDPDELLAGGRAGADYLLSLHEESLWVADEVEALPVLIPSAAGDMPSLWRAMECLDRRGRRYLVDPVLDPLPLGFTESIVRYSELRRHRPDAEILMGIGNVTELTDADSGGINTLLIGIATELGISHVLTTQVSAHTRRAIAEIDVARRMLFLARESRGLARDLDQRLLALHERHPFPYSAEEIAETAAAIRDPSYRVQVSEQGIHIYNRDGFHTGHDPYELFARLDFKGEAGHAFYLGTELARAQIAWQLGKRHNQDQELDWGCAGDSATEPQHPDHADIVLPGTGTES